MTIRELYDRKGALATQIREVGARHSEESGWASAEDRAAWDKVNADYDACCEQIKRAEDAANVAARMADATRGAEGDRASELARQERHHAPAGAAPTDRQRDLAFRAWMLGRPQSEEQAEAVRACRMDLAATTLSVATIAGEQRQSCWASGGRAAIEARSAGFAQRAAQTITTTAGGYLIPTGFLAQLETALLAYGGIRQVATVLRTGAGNPLNIPTVNDTGNPGRWLAINTQVTNTAFAVGQTALSAWKASSDSVLIPVELLQDSEIDVVGMTAALLGERIGRVTAAAYAVGDDSGKPNGIVTASTLGKTAASTTAITADEVIDLVHSVDPAYRAAPGCGFAFHDTVLAALRKLKDGDSQYLWQPGLQSGTPDMLFGYPYSICQDMDSTINASSKSMIFGDLSKYLIRDVGQIEVMRLVERYADYHQIGMIAFIRTDGELHNAGTNPVKHLITAAA